MKRSAGILPFRIHNFRPEFFLVHPGGPFWKNKDLGAWSVAKGEYSEDEDPFVAACREFSEETGFHIISTKFHQLQPAKQKSGKIIQCWAVEYDCDPSTLKSNTFPLEWPPNSKKFIEFPEVDKGAWFNYETARKKIIPGQRTLIIELADLLTTQLG